MTTLNTFQGRNRDQQDGFERMLWSAIEYVNGAGAVLKVRGTGTEDEEMPILNTGYGMNFPQDYNTEVFAISLGSDVTQKYALPSIPRDQQRAWPESTGGVQSPVNKDKYIEFNNTRMHLVDGAYAFGTNGILEITGNDVYIRGNLTVSGIVTSNTLLRAPATAAGTTPIPGFNP